MLTKLTEFLKVRKTAKKSEYTHTRIGDKEINIIGGSYCITANDENEFYTKYYDSVFVDKNAEYLTEKQIKGGQMVIDLDFRYNSDITNRQHTSENINDIICCYLNILQEFYDFDERPFKVYVFEKPNVNRLKDGSLTKDGLHLMFGLSIPFEVQLMIRQKMLNELPNYLNLPLINTWESVLDEGISKGTTNWTLYGSRKPQNEAYELKMVYNITFDLTDNEPKMEEDFDFDFDETTFKMLSCRYTDIPNF